MIYQGFSTIPSGGGCRLGFLNHRQYDDTMMLQVLFEGGMSPPHVGTVLQMTGLKEFQRADQNKARWQ